MKEYLTVPWEKILQAPELGGTRLAMVEPLTVGFHAVERGKIRREDITMVLGCGMIGAGAIIASAGNFNAINALGLNGIGVNQGSSTWL